MNKGNIYASKYSTEKCNGKYCIIKHIKYPAKQNNGQDKSNGDIRKWELYKIWLKTVVRMRLVSTLESVLILWLHEVSFCASRMIYHNEMVFIYEDMGADFKWKSHIWWSPPTPPPLAPNSC